jgi:hypothetical protein
MLPQRIALYPVSRLPIVIGRFAAIPVIASAAVMVLSVAALASAPAKPDRSLTSYVREHQPWLSLQARGVERFGDGNPADTSFFVFTTMAPHTDRSEAERACEAVAADLRALHLPLSLSILSRPEATMAAYSPQRSCTEPIPVRSSAYFVVSP